MDKPNPIPVFENESEKRAFWLDHDSTEYVDWSKSELASFPNLKPSMQSTSPVVQELGTRSAKPDD